MPYEIQIPNDEPAKTSLKKCGCVEAYAANTNRGCSNDLNCDRISIVTNLYPPKERRQDFRVQSKASNESDTNDSIPKWPRCSFFGIFDGYKGVKCAEFLRDNLHKYIIRD